MVFENEEAEYPTPVATPISHPGKIGRPSILQMTEEGSAGVKIHENGTNYYGMYKNSPVLNTHMYLEIILSYSDMFL